MHCSSTSCEGGLKCCVDIAQYPGYYCKVASQCNQQPLWQVIVIPSLLGFLTVALLALIAFKLRGHKAKRRYVTEYASEQIRVCRSNRGKYQTQTSLPNINSPDLKMQKLTEATPNMISKTEVSQN